MPRICSNVLLELTQFLATSSCRPYNSDVLVQVSPTQYYFPDITVTCDGTDLENGRNRAICHPKLIVEVLSESTEAVDRGRKFEHYRLIPELQEYVLVRSDRQYVETYQRGEGAFWKYCSYQDSETVTFNSVGLSLPVSGLYHRVNF